MPNSWKNVRSTSAWIFCLTNRNFTLAVLDRHAIDKRLLHSQPVKMKWLLGLDVCNPIFRPPLSWTHLSRLDVHQTKSSQRFLARKQPHQGANKNNVKKNKQSYRTKNAQPRFITIQRSCATASTIQLSKPLQIKYFSKAISPVEVVFRRSIPKSCGSSVPRT